MIIRTMLIILTICSVATATDSLEAPDTTACAPPANAVEVVADSLFGIYEKGISPTETHECPMSPSCSAFAKRAIRQVGVLKGLLLTADRLLRDNRFAQNYYSRNKDGKLIDPVERYTQWKKPSRPY